MRHRAVLFLRQSPSPLAEGRELKSLGNTLYAFCILSPLAEGRELKYGVYGNIWMEL